MFDIVEFLDMIGFGQWFAKYAESEGALTFSDLVFNTLPPFLQLALIIFLLNWIFGMMSDTVKLKFMGGRPY